MNIHQLSVRYQPEQDRILLSLNTSAGQNLDIWLTRRLTLALWPQLNLVVIDHFAIPADAKSDGVVDLAAMDEQTRSLLADFRREEVLQSMDFDTPFAADSAQSLTGATPLLATEITLSPQEGQTVHLHFKEQMSPTETVRGIQMDLQATLIFSLVQLLGQALEHTQWQAGLKTVAAEPDDTALEMAEKRPTYLN